MSKSHYLIAKELSATKGYDYVELVAVWDEYSVFFVCDKSLIGGEYGYPNYVLVEPGGKARFAKFPDEVDEILKRLPD